MNVNKSYPAEERYPFVSIGMSVFNAEAFLRTAVESILKQSYVNFEFIIIDDKSTDNSVDIVLSYSDDRIRLIRNIENKGIVYGRQLLLDNARGKYLFWMDADDISHINRIEKQVDFFQKNTAFIICGTAGVSINEANETVGPYSVPLTSEMIKATLFLGFPFIEPSIGIRMSAIVKASFRFDHSIRFSPAYNLFTNMLAGGQFANINEPLYLYRIHGKQSRITSAENGAGIIKARKIAWKKWLLYLGIKASDEQLTLHDKLTYYSYLITSDEYKNIDSYLRLLYSVKATNDRLGFFNCELLNKLIADRVQAILLLRMTGLIKCIQLQVNYFKLLKLNGHACVIVKKPLKILLNR